MLRSFRSFHYGLTNIPLTMATSELRRFDRRGITPKHKSHTFVIVLDVKMVEKGKIIN